MVKITVIGTEETGTEIQAQSTRQKQEGVKQHEIELKELAYIEIDGKVIYSAQSGVKLI